MPIVRMPDGQLVEMPDSPTPEQLAALQQVTEARPAWKGVWDDLARGLGKTVVGIPEAVMNVGRISSATARGEKPELDWSWSQGVERDIPTPQGDSKARQYLRSGLEGLGGSLITPTPLAAASGFGAGLGSQVATETMGDNPLTRVVGGIVGGGLAGAGANALQRVRPQTQELAQVALGDIDPKMLERAQQFQKLAQSRGATVDLAQALTAVGANASDITTLRNVLAQSSAGRNVQRTLENQPGELELLTSAFTGKMPGVVYGEEQAANILGQATTNTVNAAKKEATTLFGNVVDDAVARQVAGKAPAVERAVQEVTKAQGARKAAETSMQELYARVQAARQGAPSYVANAPVPGGAEAAARVAAAKQAEAAANQGLATARADVRAATQVPPDVVMAQRQRLLDLAKKSQNTALGDHLKNLADSFLDSNGIPITDAKNLNAILKDAVAKTKGINLKTPGTDVGVTKSVDRAVIETRENLGSAFEPIRQANEAFKRYYGEVVEPIKQGRVGTTAKTGYDPNAQVPVNRLVAMFGGVDPAAPSSPIRTAAKQMAQRGEGEAFQDAAKTYWSARLSDAFEATPTGGPATNLDAAKRVSNFLLQRKTYQAAKDTVASVAEMNGLNPKDAVRGLENYAQLTKAMANTPQRLGGLREDEVFRMGGQNYGSDALRIFGFLPFNTAARRMEDRVLQNTFRDLDNMMTTPEGVAKLIELGKSPVMSRRAIMTFATIGGTAGSQPQEPQQ